MKPQKSRHHEDDDFDPQELEVASDESAADDTPPEVDAKTKDLATWDEAPASSGGEVPAVPQDDEAKVPEDLVREGNELAERDRRIAAVDPDFEP
jgi:hypothetical protein